MSSVGEPRSSCGVELPRLFVYELPASFRRGAPSTAVGFPPLIGSEHSHTPKEHHHLHQAERVKGPPAPIKLLLESLPPPHCELRKTSNYALAGVFFAKALAYGCRTHDPQAADLFFVPVLHEEPGRANECLSPACSNPHVLADALRVLRNRRGISYIDARQGKDHLLLTPREGATSDSRPYGDVDFAKEPFEQSIRLALEEGAANFSWPTTRFKIQPYFHSTPFASYVHLPAASLKAESERAAPPWRVWRQRVILASTASNLHHEGWRIGASGRAVSQQMNTLRDALYRSCVAANSTRICSHLPLSPTHTIRRFHEYSLIREIGGLYANSVFCLQSVGDQCTRKATIDSILLGCIPVFFHPCQRMQWPWHWGAWIDPASMYFDIRLVSNGSINVVRELQSVPNQQIRKMQRVIAEHAHCLHYALPLSSHHDFLQSPNTSIEQDSAQPRNEIEFEQQDAFQISLVGAWRESRRAGWTRTQTQLCHRSPVRKDWGHQQKEHL